MGCGNSKYYYDDICHKLFCLYPHTYSKCPECRKEYHYIIETDKYDTTSKHVKIYWDCGGSCDKIW